MPLRSLIMSGTTSPDGGFEVVVGSDGALSVPAAELARHGVRPGAHLRVVAEAEQPHERVSAFGYLSDLISPEAADALVAGIEAGKADRIEALGRS